MIDENHMDLHQLSRLLKSADTKMADSIRDAQELRKQIQEALALLEGASSSSNELSRAGQPAERRRTLASPQQRSDEDTLLALSYCQEEDSYKVGRRRLALTETEKQILDLFWGSMPRPISREAIHAALYLDEQKPNLGSIDVFVSKLRQKLKLISSGREFLESSRGKGWALRPEYCGSTQRP